MEFTEVIKIKRVENVQCLLDVFQTEPHGPGVVSLSAHVLCFESQHTQVQVLNVMVDTVTDYGTYCKIYCKDFRQITLLIENKEECALFVETLQLLSNIDSIELTLPFYCKPKTKGENYQVYDELQELEWLEFPPHDWEISKANADFQITKCYSEHIVIPTGWEDVMKKLSECRVQSKAPRPTFIYKHPTRGKCMLITAGMPVENKAMQYKLLDKDYKELDMLYMAHAMKCTGRALIVTEHQLKDKLHKRGYEKWHYLRLNVPPSAIKLYMTEMTRKDTWVAGNKKWLDLLWFLLCSTEVLMSNMTELGRTIFLEVYPRVLSSLVQICLESRYRTHYGLITCILRKDWLHSGYHFRSESRDNSCSEFLLFLHSLRQLTLWYPTAFQYSENFLIALHAHVNASRYGDFLCDTESECREFDVKHRTVSLWEGEFAGGKWDIKFVNPSYKPSEEAVIPWVHAPFSVQSWGRVFLRHADIDIEQEITHKRRFLMYAKHKALCQ